MMSTMTNVVNKVVFKRAINFFIFAAVLFELNQVVRVKIRNIFKKDKEGNSLIKKFLKTISTYVVFVLPIIIAAVFLETYIADTILHLFQ
jgi:hypothetical protein